MLEDLIKKLRIEHGFTQEFMASELGISRPTYLQLEKGQRDVTVPEAQKLAALFGMSCEALLSCEMPRREVVLEKETTVKKSKDTIHVRVRRKNLKKFKQVILYVLAKIGAQPNVGETVLHKLLYFIDFDYYEKYEENLMGAKYIKNLHGPTSVELGAILQDMQETDTIEAVKSRYFKYSQKKYLPVKRPDLSVLSAREIAHIDEVLARLASKNAKELEDYSHEDIPWKTASDGKVISYESVFYRDEHYSVRNYDDEI